MRHHDQANYLLGAATAAWALACLIFWSWGVGKILEKGDRPPRK
jgi:hypothetical protein